MKGVVNCYLNVRVGRPSVNAANPAYLKKGDEVVIIDTIYGDDVEKTGNRLWYKLDNGSFIWSGGVSLNPSNIALDWWFDSYDIPKVWESLNTKGEKSKIAIIDTGIDPNYPYLDPFLIKGTNSKERTGNYIDTDGHGTAVAGINLANGMNLVGIAPLSELYIIKAAEGVYMNEDELINGLKSVPDDIDIVCISHALSYSEKLELKLKLTFQEYSNKVFICAAGDNGIKNTTNNLPASLSRNLKNVISVASLNQEGKVSELYSCRSDYLTLSAPGENIKYLNKWDPLKIYAASGTSFSAPIVSGLFSLAKSHLMYKNKYKNIHIIIDILNDTLSYKNERDRTLYGFGTINPIAFSQKIKSI